MRGRTWRDRGVWLLAIATAIALPHVLDARAWRALSFGPATSRGDTRIGRTTLISGAISLESLIASAYEVHPGRIVGPRTLLDQRIAVEAVADETDGDRFRQMLQKAIAEHYRLDVHREKRQTGVLVLRRAKGRTGPEPTSSKGALVRVAPGRWTGPTTMRGLASGLERLVTRPVIDQTGLPGRYAIDLSWEPGDVASLSSAIEAALGIELRPETREVEVLIVDRLEPPKPSGLLGEAQSWMSAWQWPGLVSQFLQAVSNWLSLPDWLRRLPAALRT